MFFSSFLFSFSSHVSSLSLSICMFFLSVSSFFVSLPMFCCNPANRSSVSLVWRSRCRISWLSCDSLASDALYNWFSASTWAECAARSFWFWFCSWRMSLACLRISWMRSRVVSSWVLRWARRRVFRSICREGVVDMLYRYITGYELFIYLFVI